VADDLVRELRSKDLPAESVRSVARQLTDMALAAMPWLSASDAAGVVGDERDRELLLLLG